MGYQTFKTQLYSEVTTSADIDLIQTNMCNVDTILCAGAGPTSNDILDILACGNCYIITTETTLNAPKFEGSAWWYFTRDVSFGFSPNSYIQQDDADVYDTESGLRLSWHLLSPGYRAGSYVTEGDDYTKYLLIYDIPATSKFIINLRNLFPFFFK